jgi:hypothetical protein
VKPVTIEKSAKIKMLVYGDSGTGKTHLIGTFMEAEESSPVLVLDAGGQPVSFRAFDPPPLVLQLEDTKDLNLPYKWIKAGQPWKPVVDQKEALPFFKAVYGYFGGEENKFKTIAIDSITHVQRLSLDHLTESTQTLPGDYGGRPQIQHWGSVLSQLTRIANLFYQLPVHVVITALTKKDNVESLGLMLFGPFIWGQGSNEVPSHAEIVARLVGLETLKAQQAQAVKAQFPQEFAKAYNVLLTRGGRTFLAKWQGVVNPPDVIVAPTATKILAVLAGTK